jgi:hypothetical protein
MRRTAPIGAVSEPAVPAPQSQTHNPGRPVFSMPSHPCADQRGALSCPLTCSIGSRPLIAMNRTRPTGAERGCARWSIGRSGCTFVRKQLYVCDGAVGEIGDHGEIREDISCQFPAGNPCHNSTSPDRPGGMPVNRTRIDAKASWLAGQALGGVVETFAGFATSLPVIPGGLVDSFHGFAASFWHRPLLPSLFVFPMSIKSPPIHQRGSRRGV